MTFINEHKILGDDDATIAAVVTNSDDNTDLDGENGVVNASVLYGRISADIISQDFDVKLDFYDDVDAGGNRVFGFQKQIHTETLSAGVFREKMVDMKFFVGESILNGSGTISLVGTKSFEATVIGWNLTILKIAR